MFDEKAQLLRIYLAERDRCEGLPLSDWILNKALERGIAGATAIKGFSGFCAHSPVASPAIISATVNLPIVIEIVEQADVIKKFAAEIEQSIPEGLMTVENVFVQFINRRQRP